MRAGHSVPVLNFDGNIMHGTALAFLFTSNILMGQRQTWNTNKTVRLQQAGEKDTKLLREAMI